MAGVASGLGLIRKVGGVSLGILAWAGAGIMLTSATMSGFPLYSFVGEVLKLGYLPFPGLPQSSAELAAIALFTTMLLPILSRAIGGFRRKFILYHLASVDAALIWITIFYVLLQLPALATLGLGVEDTLGFLELPAILVLTVVGFTWVLKRVAKQEAATLGLFVVWWVAGFLLICADVILVLASYLLFLGLWTIPSYILPLSVKLASTGLAIPNIAAILIPSASVGAVLGLWSVQTGRGTMSFSISLGILVAYLVGGTIILVTPQPYSVFARLFAVGVTTFGGLFDTQVFYRLTRRFDRLFS